MFYAESVDQNPNMVTGKELEGETDHMSHRDTGNSTTTAAKL